MINFALMLHTERQTDSSDRTTCVMKIFIHHIIVIIAVIIFIMLMFC